MVAAPRVLPDLNQLDPVSLKALIFLQHEQLLSKDAQLIARDNEIEQLKLLIAKLRRMQFGRKSEKLDRQIEQLELRLDELQATQGEHANGSPPPAVGAAPCQRRGETSTKAAARAPAARSAKVSAKAESLSRLRRRVETSG